MKKILSLILLLSTTVSFAAEKDNEQTIEVSPQKLEQKADIKKSNGQRVSLSNLSLEEKEIYQYGEISTGSLIGGGLAGTFLGLGIGHAVYGKYTSKGWIFTVGELGSFTIMALGVSQIGECFWGSSSGCSNAAGTYVVGAIAFLGFRIWELIDVWTLPSSHNRQYQAIKSSVELGSNDKQNFFLLPLLSTQGAYGLRLGVNF